MYTRLQPLSESAVVDLLELKEQVTFSNADGARRRQGLNDFNALSIYSYSKWFNWTSAQRTLVKQHLPEKQTGSAKQLWFLELPPKTGFLDVMDYWVGLGNRCGKVCAYALQDQTILIAGKAVNVKKGGGIYFCLSEIHQIKPCDAGQLWLCVMTMRSVNDVT